MGTMIESTQGADRNAVSTHTLKLSGYVDNIVLVANTAQTYTVPTGARLLVVSCTSAELYIRSGATAAVPSANAVTGAGSMLVPSTMAVDVNPNDTISLICASAAVVSIAVYS